MDPAVLANKIYQKAEKYSTALRFFSVLVSGTSGGAVFPKRKYYVEHLVFSLYYYSFDFLCKSLFALLFLTSVAVGLKIPTMVLNFFYPLALVYLVFALRCVYQQKWAMTLLKSLVLFCVRDVIFRS